MLDLLPVEVWSDPTLRWLDPGCKTGVFPREITKRLMVGLEDVIPDEDVRLKHILKEMVFGLAITELTSLMSRRTLYCSKDASGIHSVVRMKKSAGNIWFERVEHTFDSKGRCAQCRATRSEVERDLTRENYAYSFIHDGGRRAVEEEIEMKFDVIVGNPPYQMADGGPGGSASPIYQEFIQQAIELNPRYVVMIVPSRWFVGGKGLSDFRSRMLSDRRVRKLVDYQDARDLFPGINLNGGVNYFLWDRDHDGPCEVTSVHQSGRQSSLTRELGQYDVFVRLNEAVGILEKVKAKKEPTFESKVSSVRPFGFRTFFHGKTSKAPKDSVTLYGHKATSWVRESEVAVNAEWIDEYKVLIPAATDGNEIYPLPVLTEPLVVGPGTACTETYLVIGPCRSRKEAENLAAYMKTRFFRFLLTQRKHAQHNSKDKFSFIPDLEMSKKWTDEELYARYKVTKDEQAFIAEQIKEMS
jgi:site-specific DNA-methyltransferase (adenine-specific)